MIERLFRPSAILSALLVLIVAGCGPGLELDEKLKVAGIYTASVGSPGADPWSDAVHQALLRARRELDILYDFRATVAPADFEGIARDYAQKGYDLIVGDAHGREEVIRRVARDFPEAAFLFASSLGPVSPNFSVFDFWLHEPAYLCGLLAGSLTRSGIVGAVGGEAVPRDNRVLNAFRLGVEEVNPDARVLIAFAGRHDPPAARQLADEMIDRGADLIYAGTSGVIDACRRRGVLVFGHLADQHLLGVNVVVTSSVWDLGQTIKSVVDDIERDRYRAADYAHLSRMFNRGANLAPYHGLQPRIPRETRDLVHRRRLQIMSGLHRVPVIESEPEETINRE